MQFKKDLLKVFSSNFINLIIGIINGFLIPAYLSLGHYASLKTFTLYLSYAGILHFGFIDGIFLKYGGKTENEIDAKILKGEHKFLVLLLLAVTLLSTSLGFILQDKILIAFAITILPINIQTLYRFLFQALGQFNIFSKIIVLTPNLLLIFNLVIIFILKVNNFWPFVLANVLGYYIVFIWLEIYFLKKYQGVSSVIDFKEIRRHFKIGFFIMVGNFATMLFYSLDRWFVKLSLSSNDFALYSFALSMMFVINTLINSVTMTFYPYLARGHEEGKIKLLKKYLLIIGVLASGAYFPFYFVVTTFLTKYSPSLEIIAILFASLPAMIIINALYINMYKTNKQEKRYLYTVVFMCTLSALLNILGILIYKSSISIALATTIAFYIWYFYSSNDFASLRSTIKEILFLALYFLIFLLCIEISHWLIGIIVFYVLTIGITYLLFKKELFMLIDDVLKK